MAKKITKREGGIQIPVTIGKKEHLIQSDRDQWTISSQSKKLNKETEEWEEVWTGIKFFTSAKGMCNYLAEWKLKASEATTLEQLVLNLQEIKLDIKKLYDATTV